MNLEEHELEALTALVGLALTVEMAMDECDERETGGWIGAEHLANIDQMLTGLDGLPDDKPGYTLGAAAKAAWALRRLVPNVI